MKKLQIVRVDADSVQKADLQIGDNIIGVGIVSECKDDKLPKHAITINVNPQGEMKINTLTPCYMKSSGKPSWIQLQVGSTVPIHIGDLFSLLSDKYWFKIISVDLNMEDNETSLKRKLGNETDQVSGKKLRQEESMEALLPPNGNVDDVPSSTGVDPGQEEFNASDYEEAGAISTDPISNNIYGASVPEGGEASAATSSTKLEANGSSEMTNSNEASGEIESGVNTTEDRTRETDLRECTEFVTVVDESLDNDEAEKKIKWDCGKHFSDCNNQLAASSVVVPDIEQPAESTSQDNTAITVVDSAVSNTQRNKCMYGSMCYRKNEEHKAQFSHPGDLDYETLDNRPECPYGIRCYRKNPQHKKDFKHTIQRLRRPQTPIRAKTPEASTTDHSSFEESIDESDYEPSWCLDSSDEFESNCEDNEETW